MPSPDHSIVQKNPTGDFDVSWPATPEGVPAMPDLQKDNNENVAPTFNNILNEEKPNQNQNEISFQAPQQTLEAKPQQTGDLVDISWPSTPGAQGQPEMEPKPESRAQSQTIVETQEVNAHSNDVLSQQKVDSEPVQVDSNVISNATAGNTSMDTSLDLFTGSPAPISNFPSAVTEIEKNEVTNESDSKNEPETFRMDTPGSVNGKNFDAFDDAFDEFDKLEKEQSGLGQSNVVESNGVTNNDFGFPQEIVTETKPEVVDTNSIQETNVFNQEQPTPVINFENNTNTEIGRAHV